MNITTDISNQPIELAQSQQQQSVAATSPSPITQSQEAGYQEQNAESESSSDERKKDLVEAIEKANNIQIGKTECQFSIHEATNRLMVKIVDQSTKQIIKELPSEKVLDMVAKMCEVNGVFVDEKR